MLRNETLNGISLDFTRNMLSKKIYEDYQGVIQYGLFQGLQVAESGYWDGGGDAGAKILGLYEQQILEQFETMEKFHTLVNIGAADGYYGFGLILAEKCEKAIFFESSPKSCNEIKKMNEKYNFDIEIHGEANKEKLHTLLEKHSVGDKVFLIDIEGGEFEIFNDDLIRKIAGCSIILELHEFLSAEFDKQVLERRFIKYFSIKKVNNNLRRFPQSEGIRTMHDNKRWLLASEGRLQSMEWWILTPHKVIDL